MEQLICKGLTIYFASLYALGTLTLAYYAFLQYWIFKAKRK